MSRYRGMLVALLFVVLSVVLVGCYGTVTPPPANQHLLTISVQGGGSVVEAGHSFDEGTLVTLTPQPDAGWVFSNWQGANAADVVGGKIAMTGDKTLVAVFTQSIAPPSIVSGLTMGTAPNYYLKLTWQSPSDSSVAWIEVWRKKAGESAFIKAAEVSRVSAATQSWEDYSSLVYGVKYTYKLRAKVDDNTTSAYGQTFDVIVGDTSQGIVPVPTWPQDAIVSRYDSTTGNYYVDLKWNAVSGTAGPYTYMVYYTATPPSGSAITSNEPVDSGTTWSKAFPAGTEFECYLKAVDAANRLSLTSSSQGVTVAGKLPVAPETDFAACDGTGWTSGHVHIVWKAVREYVNGGGTIPAGGLKGYNVYRRHKATASSSWQAWILVTAGGPTSATSFDDVVSDTTGVYEWSVTAVTIGDRESAKSAPNFGVGN